MKLNEIFTDRETYQPPSLQVGDEVKVGKFKNRRAEITGFEKDDHGQPVLKTTKGDQKLFKPRVSKLEPLDESLDQPYQFQWDFKALTLWEGSFSTSDLRRFFVSCMQGVADGPDTWTVTFSDQFGNFGLSGKGDSLRIFATIRAMLTDFVNNVKPDLIYFTADKSSHGDSRYKLYRTMMARFAKSAGYNWEEDDVEKEVEFRLTRLNEDINAVEIEDIVEPKIRSLFRAPGLWDSAGTLSGAIRKHVGAIVKDYMNSMGIKKTNVIVEIKLRSEPGSKATILYNHENRRVFFSILISRDIWKNVTSDRSIAPKFANQLKEIVVHELMHARQWIASQGKMANRTGYLGNIRKSEPAYLSDKQEISPYAANAVQELMGDDYDPDLILQHIYEPDVIQQLISASPTFAQYHKLFQSNPDPKYQKAWKRFLRKFIQHLEDRSVAKREKEQRLQARAKAKGWVQ